MATTADKYQLALDVDDHLRGLPDRMGRDVGIEGEALHRIRLRVFRLRARLLTDALRDMRQHGQNR